MSCVNAPDVTVTAWLPKTLPAEVLAVFEQGDEPSPSQLQLLRQCLCFEEATLVAETLLQSAPIGSACLILRCLLRVSMVAVTPFREMGAYLHLRRRRSTLRAR